jgi:hypothetical protein
MNALNLLTKGHTIRGLEERDREYKLLNKSALPNFSALKRPVPTTPHIEPENTQPVSMTETAAPAAPPKAGLWRCLASRALNWVNRRFSWRKGALSRKPAVQAELGLDKVKVMRNDLSEEDWEVVAIEKKTENT